MRRPPWLSACANHGFHRRRRADGVLEEVRAPPAAAARSDTTCCRPRPSAVRRQGSPGAPCWSLTCSWIGSASGPPLPTRTGLSAMFSTAAVDLFRTSMKRAKSSCTTRPAARSSASPPALPQSPRRARPCEPAGDGNLSPGPPRTSASGALTVAADGGNAGAGTGTPWPHSAAAVANREREIRNGAARIVFLLGRGDAATAPAYSSARPQPGRDARARFAGGFTLRHEKRFKKRRLYRGHRATQEQLGPPEAGRAGGVSPLFEAPSIEASNRGLTPPARQELLHPEPQLRKSVLQSFRLR